MIHDLSRATRQSIRIICATLAVPRSSYYHAARPTATQRSDEETGRVIETIFRTHCRRYGYRRIGAELADREITCAPERVRRLMRERRLKALQPRSFVPKTSDGRGRTAPRSISCWNVLFPKILTRCGPAISLIFPPPKAGSIWPW